MKKTISLLLSIILVVALTIPTMAADVTSFSDVPTAHWAYSPIKAMANLGIINGTSDPDTNGIATYSPDDTMTKGQFIAIITRYFYEDELKSMGPTDGPWYANNFAVALEQGIIKKSEFTLENMEQECNRQEMSMFMVRALEEAKGETVDELVPTSRIPDYSTIGTYYQTFVRQSYSMGLLAGIDDNGTFAPRQNMNRAQAATVLYRMIEPSTRLEVDFTPRAPASTGTQTWVEGEPHDMPHKGDIVTKADGTQVVLDYGYGNILGAGQGVDIYTGWVNPGSSCPFASDGKVYNASGFADMTIVEKDPITGEAHTSTEWLAIQRVTGPKEPGSYVGEVRNTWFTWDGSFWISSIPR